MTPVLEILIWKFLSLSRWSGLVDSWIVKSIIEGRGPDWRNTFRSNQSEMVFKAMDKVSGRVSASPVEKVKG